MHNKRQQTSSQPGVPAAENSGRWRLHVDGVVQGVGFRPFVAALAEELHLSGWVRNSSAGVELELQGAEPQLQAFLTALHHHPPPLAWLTAVAVQPIPPITSPTGHTPQLQILPSLIPTAAVGPTTAIGPTTAVGPTAASTLIPPDVATCAQCLDELNTLTDRRYRYPFTNCTHCGPRFTIIANLPYDRPHTSMADFPLCATCAAEYHQPTDRRFHAQPVACPSCGPTIWFQAVSDGELQTGQLAGEAALTAVVHLLNQGGIVAIKGLGGFHLACRADSALAIARLRAAKGRPHKPLAVMVPDLASAHSFTHLTPAEERLLQSPQAPIVLLRQRPEANTVQLTAVAPQNDAIGVLLPYTPLHYLLLQGVGAPLVMTSGNQRDAPLCLDNDLVQLELAPLADGFLFHNRPILRRCDDSVLFVADGAAAPVVQLVRRSRGYVPLPVALPPAVALSAPLLAVGGDLKNTVAVAMGEQAILSAHVGTLAHPATRRAHAQAIADLSQLFGLQPQIIVADSHPDYASSGYARQRAQAEGLALLEVQHHHAHIAGCLAENNCLGPAIGLCFDGTGYGSDGRLWGGEVLLADLASFTRLAHLPYLPLPGGEAAIQRPLRLAAAYLHTLLPGTDLAALLPHLPAPEMTIIQTMVDGAVNCPLTSSMGRLFDAVSALLGLCPTVTYEAQAAIALEQAAWQSADNACWPNGRWASSWASSLTADEIDLVPLLAQLVADRRAGVAVPTIAHRFHQAVAQLAVAAAQSARQTYGVATVALSGGVWQNRLLLTLTVPKLRQAGFTVLLHRAVPANDGGLAYGQTAVAAARLKRGELCV